MLDFQGWKKEEGIAVASILLIETLCNENSIKNPRINSIFHTFLQQAAAGIKFLFQVIAYNLLAEK